MITEGKARIDAHPGKVTRKMPVFYNPAMKLNRDISVMLLKAVSNRNMRIADPLAASGIRSIRFLKELQKAKVKELLLNDGSKDAVRNIKRNLRLNKITKKVTVANEEASIFLLKNRGFDYIDIDPFGSPVPFLDAAVRSLSRNGILAVTATDTAALSGTAPKACIRKYWAMPLRNYTMHEYGLRILIRRVQLAAASHERALTPIYSYAKLHYMRVFFKCDYGAKATDDVLKQHRIIEDAGPMWTGKLWDAKLAAAISRQSDDDFVKTVGSEARISASGFYDTHVICKKYGINVPSLAKVISELKKKGFKAARTHLNGNGIRTNASPKEVTAAIRSE